MKAKTGLILITTIAVLVFCGTALAENSHTVKKDECLSVIGAKLNVDWRKIAKTNGIKHPYVIYPNQKLIIPKPDEYFDVESLGRNPFRGVGDYELGWKQFNLSADEIVELNEKIVSGDFAWKSIRSGDVFNLGLEGKNILRLKPRMWIHEKGHNEAARVYILSTRTEVWLPLKCENPYLRKMCLIETAVIPKPIMKPVIVAEKKKLFVYISPAKRKLALEHEPLIGAYAWKNDLARGWGGYGEYVAWLRKASLSGYTNGWSPGIGLYGMYSEGDSRKSSYHWLEKGIGPQAGIKYIAAGEKPWQWQGKLRLVWEKMKGSNTEGYGMEQDNLKLGFYTEYARKESKKWIWGATGETWFALHKSINSTWSGDKPSRRMNLAFYLFAQRKLSDDWQLRGASGLFYQRWDHLTGLRAQLEARYKETLMFGPWVSFFPFGLTSVYDGFSASDLTTVGGFVRVELGGIFREWDRNARMSRIKEVDEAWLESP